MISCRTAREKSEKPASVIQIQSRCCCACHKSMNQVGTAYGEVHSAEMKNFAWDQPHQFICVRVGFSRGIEMVFHRSIKLNRELTIDSENTFRKIRFAIRRCLQPCIFRGFPRIRMSKYDMPFLPLLCNYDFFCKPRRPVISAVSSNLPPFWRHKS
jgi:hypothetical protein